MNKIWDYWILLIPFLGTSLGAGGVLLMKNEMHIQVKKGMLGFASGVMVAASVWSLLLPSMEMSAHMERLAFLPAAVGLAVGMLFLLLIDKVIPHLHLGENKAEGLPGNLKKTTMLLFAVTLHNIPEGMAVGVVFAGFASGQSKITFAAALALALGIAIQNFPEGAVISIPLKNEGMGKWKAFFWGSMSGAVEPIAAVVMILFANVLLPLMPYTLAFAAGAMLYVVVEELIPEASEGEHSNVGTLGFGLGFIVMMVLDVAMG